MFTKNWYGFLSVIMGGTSYVPNEFVGLVGTVNTHNNTPNGTGIRIGYNANDYWAPSIYKLRTSIDSYSGAILGTGTTQPSPDDYWLSGDIIAGYVYSSSVTEDRDENGVTFTAIYTITNNNSEPITIGEIGLIGSIANGSSTNGNTKCLLERTLLESPITIEAGGVGQVTYTIRMNYPTA